ncbi:MAG: hypothetical protein Q9209_003672 [Squamulea sp. 1 TL-2023]
MKEARLLHFKSNAKDATKWYLSMSGYKGMPIGFAVTEPAKLESAIAGETFEPGILDAITEVVGEGDTKRVKHAIVMVVKEKSKDDGINAKSDANHGWIHTPDSSVVDGL